MSELEEEIAEQMGEDEDSSADDGEQVAEDGEQGAGVDEAAADPPAPRSQKEIEEVTRKLEAEAQRHEKRVREIMGEDFAMLVPSPIDWTPGYLFNVPGMLPDEQQVGALDAILGRGAIADYLEAEDAQACDKCNALGRTLTGSKVEGQVTKPCGKCNGTGWTVRLAAAPPVAPIAYDFGSQTAAAGTPNQFQVADRWGRPFGHPHYNLDPAAVGV